MSTDHLYQAYWCEENVYHLAREPALAARPRHVVFISNEARAVAMWSQRAGRPGGAMAWDYHVVLLVAEPWEVWDLDSLLGCPVAARAYLRGSFHAGLPEEYHPRFRLVDAEIFAAAFASDRSHMRSGDRYRKPPPPWPPIGVPERVSNLMRFVDVSAPFLGEVIDLAELWARVD